jgi:hypothetical protein
LVFILLILDLRRCKGYECHGVTQMQHAKCNLTFRDLLVYLRSKAACPLFMRGNVVFTEATVKKLVGVGVLFPLAASLTLHSVLSQSNSTSGKLSLDGVIRARKRPAGYGPYSHISVGMWIRESATLRPCNSPRYGPQASFQDEIRLSRALSSPARKGAWRVPEENSPHQS